jgi:hypothetical protein
VGRVVANQQTFVDGNIRELPLIASTVSLGQRFFEVKFLVAGSRSTTAGNVIGARTQGDEHVDP